MGCFSSKRPKIKRNITTPPVTPEPEPEPEDEDENSSDFLFPSENAEKDEVKEEKTLQSYPKAAPINDQTKLKRGTEVKWFSNWTAQMDDDVEDPFETDSDMPEIRTKQDVDKHARQAPSALNSSFANLIAYLTGDLDDSDRPEVFKARALMVWLSIQDVDSKEVKRKVGNTDTPEGYITLLAQRRTTYSTVFLVLCRKAKIQCTQIDGICKAGDYEPGDENLRGLCNWNAIFVEGDWNIVHPFWICRCIVGRKAGGWIKLEAGGKTIGKKEVEAIGIMKNAFEEYYFMTDPKEFIYMCHPTEDKWQLVKHTVTKQQFLDQAYLLPPFFGLGLVMKSKDACVYQATDGEVIIKLEAPAKNANAIDMHYEFLLKEGSEEHKLEEKDLLSMESMPRLVAMIRCGERWKIRVRFPVEGTYKLRIFGAPNKTPLLRLGEFRLDCTSRRKECIPLPIDPKEVGFGPGPAAERSGLLFPSHRNGQYPLLRDKEMRFTFHLEEETVRNINVRTDLITTQYVNGKLQQRTLQSSVHTDVQRRKRELSITCKIAEDGEYALTISTVMTESSNSYRNVCNYLLSSDLTPNKENNYVRFAKNNLRKVLASKDDSRSDTDVIEEIKTALEKCRTQKVPGDDEEVESGKIRLEFLLFKIDIHDANLRQNWHVTERTVRRLQQSRFAHTFRKKIADLSQERDKLAKEREDRL
ncbi:hillarin-like [Pecten maximus]|uniref:hillarin-like n=1 Tax=Pecten maximus TaxID=6579 RepID=UPI001458F080|nr:hillarin-like [Pecten maximus]